MRFLLVAIFLFPFVGISACRDSQPQGRIEEGCVEQCKVQAKLRCNEDLCIRGCRFVLDRLMERQGPTVIACVAHGKKESCDDDAWATCAVNVGVHADGGPPAPSPPQDD